MHLDERKQLNVNLPVIVERKFYAPIRITNNGAVNKRVYHWEVLITE